MSDACAQTAQFRHAVLVLAQRGTDNRLGSPFRFVDYQRLLIDQLDRINQIAQSVGRRRHLSPADVAEFGSLVRFQLIEDDYAILRKFRGRSQIATYLSVVIERMASDYCDEKWGRWRPTRAAQRLGAEAVLLERLVDRDGHTIEEAIEIVCSHNGAVSAAQLRALWDQLPARVARKEVDERAAEGVAAGDRSDALIAQREHQDHVERLHRALRSAFERIAAQDRVVMALRFDQDLSIAEISHLMRISVPTLHRRLAHALKQLREALMQAGFTAPAVADLVGQPSATLPPMLRVDAERFLSLVRLSK